MRPEVACLLLLVFFRPGGLSLLLYPQPFRLPSSLHQPHRRSSLWFCLSNYSCFIPSFVKSVSHLTNIAEASLDVPVQSLKSVSCAVLPHQAHNRSIVTCSG